MAGRKHSDFEREERILFILDLRSKGVKSTSDLFRFFTEKYNDVTKRQFEYDLQKAKALISEYHEKDLEFTVSEISKHLWELYNKNLKIQDYRECRNVLKDYSDLLGLKIQKIDITGEIPIKVEVKDFI
jgi:hypothetical protein